MRIVRAVPGLREKRRPGVCRRHFLEHSLVPAWHKTGVLLGDLLKLDLAEERQSDEGDVVVQEFPGSLERTDQRQYIFFVEACLAFVTRFSAFQSPYSNYMDHKAPRQQQSNPRF